MQTRCITMLKPQQATLQTTPLTTLTSLAAVLAISGALLWIPATHAATAADEHAGHHAAADNAGADKGDADKRSADKGATDKGATDKAAAGAVWVNGEVRRIDVEGGKLTLKHDAIPQFEMAAMTMVFRVAEPGLLAGLAVGDQVRFRIEKINQRFTVMELQKQR